MDIYNKPFSMKAPNLTEQLSRIKEIMILKEYDNYNYPAGADANPDAPWNQPEPDELDSWEIDENGTVVMYSTGNGTARVDLDVLIPDGEDGYDDLFNRRNEIMTDPNLKVMMDDLVGDYVDNGSVEWEYDDNDGYEEPEPDYDAQFDSFDDYLDESKKMDDLLSTI